MKVLACALVCLFAFVCMSTLFGQTTTQTPNLKLYLPAHGSLDWDLLYNANWGILDKVSSVARISTNYTGVDCGAQINAAYASLPSTGGRIIVPAACSFATPITFSTANKMAILEGVGNGSVLTYTGVGTAITFDNGILFDMSSGMRDITLIGPGSANLGVTGVQFGGTRGCVGCSIEHSRIQAFGTGLHLSTLSWNTSFYQDQFTDNTTAIDDTFTGTSGEGIVFSRCTFSTVTSLVTKVNIGNGDIDFVGSNFDQAQLILVPTSGPAPIVRVHGGHFENPNGSFYDYIQVNSATGNTLALYGVDFLDDGATVGTRPEVIKLNGGKLTVYANTMFSPQPYTHFVTLAGSANLDLFSFADLGGNITSGYIGGTTTGYVTSWPGANPGTAIPPNFVLSSGVNVGGSRFHVEGNIRAAYSATMGAANSGQLISEVPTGTAGLNITSRTPVANLFADGLWSVASDHPTAHATSSDAVQFEVIQDPTSVMQVQKGGHIAPLGHINQIWFGGQGNVGNYISGTSTTTFAFNFNTAFTSAPICAAVPGSPLPAGVQYGCGCSTTNCTVTTSSAVTNGFSIIAIGNPN
jgi:hypothetical protein